MKEILKVNNLIKKFPKAGGKIDDADAISVLKGINFDVEQGEYVGIMGKSGCGKTTLLKILGFMDQQTDGDVIFDGANTNELWKEELTDIRRRKIGFVFQTFNLVPRTSALKNVALPMMYNGVRGTARTQRARALLDMVEMGDRAGHAPSQLSGGQKQRVAIARALATQPEMLLCDEPTSALDPLTTKSMLALLTDINKKLGVTIIIITHELSVVQAICSHVAVISEGRLAESGAVADVFGSPRSAVTKLLLGREE